MIARCLSTLIALLLAFYAFWGDALGAGRLFNPFGLMFLLFAYILWFKWEIVRSAFRATASESDIPILRLGYKVFQGMVVKPPPVKRAVADAPLRPLAPLTRDPIRRSGRALSPDEALRAMVVFLARYAERSPGQADLQPVLRDLHINSIDGLPYDRVAWNNWLAAVDAVLAETRGQQDGAGKDK